MTSVEERIDIDVPGSTAYNQWTKVVLWHDLDPEGSVEPRSDVPRHKPS